MKKTTLTIVGALAMAGSVFAQGTINFSSFVPTYITAQTNAASFSPLLGGGAGLAGGTQGATAIAANGFYFELLFSASGNTQPTTLAALNAWTDSTWYAINSASSAGRLAAGNGNNGVVVSGMTVGTAYSVMLAGWSANLGTSYSAALAKMNSPALMATVVGNGYFGLTTVGTVTPTSTTAPGATIFGVSPLINSPNTQLYLVTPVPEPSTLALAGLGGLALLALRRRK